MEIMAGRLSGAASRFLGGDGDVSRSVGSSLRLRSGKHIVPNNCKLNLIPRSRPLIKSLKNTFLHYFCYNLDSTAQVKGKMAEGRKPPVMSFELAMEKEMEYRKFLQSKGVVTDEPLVDIPAFATERNRVPSPIGNLCPTPTESRKLCQNQAGEKGKAPMPRHSPARPLLQKQHTPNVVSDTPNKEMADELFCKTCQVPCSSLLNLKQHLRGHKHKAKLVLAPGPQNMKKNTFQWCHLCRISCSSRSLYELHLKGQKHQAALVASRGGSSAKSKQRTFCKLCGIWCIDTWSYELHLKGRKHLGRQAHEFAGEHKSAEVTEAEEAMLEWGDQ